MEQSQKWVEKARSAQHCRDIKVMMPESEITPEVVSAYMDSPVFHTYPEVCMASIPQQFMSEDVVLRFVREYIGPDGSALFCAGVPAAVLTEDLALKIIAMTEAPVIYSFPVSVKTDKVFRAAFEKNPFSFCAMPKRLRKQKTYLEAITRIIEAAEAGHPYHDYCFFSAERLINFAPDLSAVPFELKYRLTRIDSSALACFAARGLFGDDPQGPFTAEAWQLVCAAAESPILAESARKAIPQKMIKQAFLTIANQVLV
jgi:hypothetical protein